jgi:dTDP-4-dehydrorhamnose 3,5-epimerase
MTHNKLNEITAFEIPVFLDPRGSFEVFWEEELFQNRGFSFRPTNAHHSYNVKKGTIRAFHYQESPYGQTKLVSCVAGRIWDVIVDLRRESTTFLQWKSFELSAESGRSVFIPAGCAHGFVTLEDHSTVSYLIEGGYHPPSSRVLRWNDPSFNVPWPISDPILSDKDRDAPLWIETQGTVLV